MVVSDPTRWIFSERPALLPPRIPRRSYRDRRRRIDLRYRRFSLRRHEPGCAGMRPCRPCDGDPERAGPRGDKQCFLCGSQHAVAVCDRWREGLPAAVEAPRGDIVDAGKAAATAALVETRSPERAVAVSSCRYGEGGAGEVGCVVSVEHVSMSTRL